MNREYLSSFVGKAQISSFIHVGPVMNSSQDPFVLLKFLGIYRAKSHKRDSTELYDATAKFITLRLGSWRLTKESFNLGPFRKDNTFKIFNFSPEQKYDLIRGILKSNTVQLPIFLLR